MDSALTITRGGLSLAGSGATAGFAIAKQATRFGFGITKFFAEPVLHQLGAPDGIIDLVEQTALAGIGVSEWITNKSISSLSSSAIAAHSITGGGESLRLLTIFGELVKSEYTSVLPTDPPGTPPSHTSFITGAVSWAALQSITKGSVAVDEALEKLDLGSFGRAPEEEGGVIFSVVSEQVEGEEEIIEAVVSGGDYSPKSMSEEEITVDRLKRYSKLCLGSYGVAGSIVFGSKLPNILSPGVDSPAATALNLRLDEENLANAFEHPFEQEEVDLDENEIENEGKEEQEKSIFARLFRDEHDVKILESHGAEIDSVEVVKHVFGAEKRRNPPRYFVVTNSFTNTIQIIVRGTLSIDDIATDLACESEPFDSSSYWDQEEIQIQKDSDQEEIQIKKKAQGHDSTFQVHKGMFEIARAMGAHESALSRSVSKALEANPTYELHLIGHSLGAGACALLGTIWTNPSTGKTSSKSPLPPNRVVKVYAFAPPAISDARLSVLLQSFVYSFVNGVDAVPRFSLGSIRDIKSASTWISHLDSQVEQSLLSRILYFKGISKSTEELAAFNSMREFIESKMIYSELCPPGIIYYLTAPSDIGLQTQSSEINLYKVKNSAIVFKEMILSPSLLSAHLPHKYMQAIHTAFE